MKYILRRNATDSDQVELIAKARNAHSKKEMTYLMAIIHYDCFYEGSDFDNALWEAIRDNEEIEIKIEQTQQGSDL